MKEWVRKSEKRIQFAFFWDREKGNNEVHPIWNSYPSLLFIIREFNSKKYYTPLFTFQWLKQLEKVRHALENMLMSNL